MGDAAPQRNSSRTALGVAALRAAHQLLDGEPKILDDRIAALQTSTLNFSEPTFFSCLGVLVYLTREAADAVFQLVAGFPAGSEIVFTFSTPESSRVDEDPANRAALADVVNSLGEPWQTYFDPETLLTDLRKLGFGDVSFLSSEEADRRYFQGRSDGLRAPRRRGIGAAIVGRKPS